MASDASLTQSTPVEETEQLAADISTLEIRQEIKEEMQHDAKQEIPPHRSHDPANSQKRSDPFQFGSRYLEENDDVFEFNAWDHVETDDAYKEYAEQQFALQRQSPVSDWDKRKLLDIYSATSRV